MSHRRLGTILLALIMALIDRILIADSVLVFLENKLMEENISLKSNDPYTLNFGIDELLKMNDLSQERIGTECLNQLVGDPNLVFRFGQVIIDDPSQVSSKARYYRSRDHLND